MNARNKQEDILHRVLLLFVVVAFQRIANNRSMRPYRRFHPRKIAHPRRPRNHFIMTQRCFDDGILRNAGRRWTNETDIGGSVSSCRCTFLSIGVDHVHVRIFWIGRFEHADDFISLSKRCFLVVFTQIVTNLIPTVPLSDIHLVIDCVLPVSRFLCH